MPKKSFLTVADASTLTFDADLSKNFQVTLGGNRAIKIAGGQEGDEISILLIQGGSGSCVPTWSSNVSFKAGQAPNLSTAVGATDLITFVKKGSTWQDVGGAPSKLPARIGVAALAVMTLANSVGQVIQLSAGSGAPSEIGRVGNVRQIKVGTGSNATTTILEGGSGSYLLSASGSGLGVGIANLKSTSRVTEGQFYVLPSGDTTIRGAMSGYTLNVSGLGAAPAGSVPCIKANGLIGWRAVSLTGSLIPLTCN
jgi:hypothetical protein